MDQKPPEGNRLIHNKLCPTPVRKIHNTDGRTEDVWRVLYTQNVCEKPVMFHFLSWKIVCLGPCEHANEPSDSTEGGKLFLAEW